MLGLSNFSWCGAPSGGSAPSAGGAASPPTAPSAFFASSSINFTRPSDGWINWSFALDLPLSEKQHAIYLCYEIETTSDSVVPFMLKNVSHFKGPVQFAPSFPCYSQVKSERPLLRGDRLRIAIDTGAASGPIETFLENVSVLNLNVVLNVVPPLQVALLRANLGSTPTTTGIGGNQAAEADNSQQNQCFLQILRLASASDPQHPCSLPEQLEGKPEHAKRAIILVWPFTLPGDVIPTISLSALYTTPNNGQAWRNATIYPQGSVVKCPGENVCVVTEMNTNPLGRLGISGPTEPSWPDPTKIKDGDVNWATLTANFKLGGKSVRTPDGKPLYEPGDRVVWTSGQNLVESEVEEWHKYTQYTKDRSIVLCPPTKRRELQQLCVATSTGRSGAEAFANLDGGLVSDGGNQFKWRVETDDQDHPNERWERNKLYQLGYKIRCEQPAQQGNLCTASVGGFSGSTEPWWPLSGAGPATTSSVGQRDNQVVWGAFSPSNAIPSSNQVVNLGTQELTQVHAPSLWGVSAAYLWTTSQIPNSYAFVTPETTGCPTVDPNSKMTVACPNIITNHQKSGDIALLVSAYVFHHIYSKVNPNAPDGIDTESSWTPRKLENWIPEPFMGFGVTSLGNSYYAGLSFEVGVRNLQFIGGRGWTKAPFLTNPIVAVGSQSGTVTPTTYTAFAHTWFVGVAFNIAGLISGH